MKTLCKEDCQLKRLLYHVLLRFLFLEKKFKNPDENDFVQDPNYSHHKVKKNVINDYEYDSSLHPMYWEEMRHQKRRHIQYGRMHLPENYSAPSRTIMATYNSASRESLILPTDKTVEYHGKIRSVYRQPTVREVACIQGFPVDFQLPSPQLKTRYKLIGNAVPCQLSYALALTISKDIEKRMNQFEDTDFINRAKVTFDRQRTNDFLPIMPVPLRIVDEAKDFGPINKEFSAKSTKRFRRKLLSSSIRGDSCVVIFENPSILKAKMIGGPFWKSCMQKGVGKRFHRVYLDEVAIGELIKSLDSRLDIANLKQLVKAIFEELEEGIPVLEKDWVEFLGLDEEPEKYIQYITEKRKKIPCATFFQETFTEEIFNLGDYVSPIDFFDGLDAIILKVFNQKEFKYLKREYLYVKSLRDSDNHPYRSDPRIVINLERKKIPIVTVACAFLSVFSLVKMYENDPQVKKSNYGNSLQVSRKKIIDWIS